MSECKELINWDIRAELRTKCDQVKMSRMIRYFFELASQRDSSEVVTSDIDTLADLVLKTRGYKVMSVGDVQELTVWSHYILADNRLTLDEVGILLAFKVCQRHQLGSGDDQALSVVHPSEVAPECPRFVCNHYFGYLIPVSPTYNHWFEWYSIFYYKANQVRLVDQEKARQECLERRFSSYHKECDKIRYLERLIQIASDQHEQPEQCNEISSSSSFYDNSESKFNHDDEKNSSITVQDSTMVKSMDLNEFYLLPPTKLDGEDPFCEHFFEWARTLEPPQKLVTSPPSLDFSSEPNFEVSNEDFLDLNLYAVARAFYMRAVKRHNVSHDLSLMISHLIELGPKIDGDNFSMWAVIQEYGLKNPDCGTELEEDSLTLTRVARIFPWLVCQYIDAHCKEPNESKYPLWMRHPYFASLIPRHPFYHPLYQLHVLCRLDGSVLGSNLDEMEEQSGICFTTARIIHQAHFLNDSQRFLLLQKI